MSPLEQLRADQDAVGKTVNDHAFDAFMAECPLERALADREPTTAIERRHLARIRSTAA